MKALKRSDSQSVSNQNLSHKLGERIEDENKAIAPVDAMMDTTNDVEVTYHELAVN